YIYFSLPASEPTNRYGDYFGASVDPSNPKLIWLAGEYGSEYSGTYHWSTDIISAIVGTFVQTLVTCGSTGGGSYSNCGAVTGAPDSNLVNLHASNCKSPCDSAWVVGDFGNTYITGDMLIDGYSYNNGVNAYYSNVIVNVSSDDVHWSTVYNQVWNPSSTNRPAWVDIGHITNVRYVKIIAQDNGDSANLYIDSVDIG
ncbi:MAG: discoidin domain-containing protein, partial [Nitrososphaerales archaeon]